MTLTNPLYELKNRLKLKMEHSITSYDRVHLFLLKINIKSKTKTDDYSVNWFILVQWNKHIK